MKMFKKRWLRAAVELWKLPDFNECLSKFVIETTRTAFEQILSINL